MFKKVINKFKYICKNIEVFLERKKRHILYLLSFPVRVIQILKNIIFGYLFKDIHYIGKKNYLEIKNCKKIAICIGFSEWKRKYFQEYILDYNAIYLHNYVPIFVIISILKKLDEKYEIFIWSYSEKETLLSFFKINNISVKRVEDGFVRSIGFSTKKTKPLSLVIDSEDLYYNVHKQSGLETIIFEHAQTYSKKELDIARQYINEKNLKKITKYNLKNITPIDDLKIYINPHKNTILVIGQTENSMSIKFGTQTTIVDNLGLLKLAYEENEDCNIIFSPHPDIIKKMNNKIEMAEYLKYSLVITDNTSLFDLIELSDHVYTITSSSGFEALLQGKKVTCIGSPFYAHWGLTDDRDKIIERRKNYSLSIEQLFYATYIEYPKYILGNLSSTIKAIENYEYMEEYSSKDKLKILDSSFNTLNNYNFSNQKIAIVISSTEIIKFYSPLKTIFKNSDFFTLSYIDLTKIIKSTMVNAKDIQWLSKIYAAPFSKIEKNAVNLANDIASVYSILLDNLFGDIFKEKTKEKLISVLNLNLEDRIYNKCVIIESLNLLENEYDKIILYVDKHEKIFNFSNLLLSKCNKKKILFVSEINKNLEGFINKFKNINSFKRFIKFNNIEGEKEIFKSYYNNLFTSTNSKFDGEKNRILLCGNLTGRNYGYYPSSVEIIDILSTLGVDQLFVPSHKLNKKVREQYASLLRECNYKGTIVDINMTEEQLVFKYEIKSIIKNLKSIILTIIKTRFSYEILEFIKDDLFHAIDELSDQLIFFSKMINEIKNDKLLITTMDRTIYSRLLTVAAQINGIYTVCIQPVVLSTSPRYKKAIVDFIYVIDEMQKENYSNLGFSKSEMLCVGSTNLRKNINFIKEEKLIYNFNNRSLSILFIMQHSMPKIMKSVIENLAEICLVENIILYIKPHPNQEKSTIKMVSILQRKYHNIYLLKRDENTYKYVKNCNIIVGLYSNVLLEAMLADKDVLILKDNIVDESVDFSTLNISFSIEISKNIDTKIKSFIQNSQAVIDMRKRRKNYISEHPYYYSSEVLNENIKQLIRKLN